MYHLKHHKQAKHAICHLTVGAFPGVKFPITEMHCRHDEINGAYKYTVILTTNTYFRPHELYYGNACINWQLVADQRYIHGVIIEFFVSSNAFGMYSYKITMASPLARLAAQQNYRLFTKRSVSYIIEKILKNNGWSDANYKFLLNHEHPNQDTQLQYAENDLRFMQKLVKKNSIYYVFLQDANKYVLNFYDQQETLQSLAKTLQLRYNSVSNLIMNEEYVFSLKEETNPLASTGNKTKVIIKSNSRELQAGQLLEITHHSDKYDEQKFIVSNVVYHLTNYSELRNEARLVPLNTEYVFDDIPKYQPFSSALLATISQHNKCQASSMPDLDAFGNYYVSFDFCRHSNGSDMISAALPLLTHYAGINHTNNKNYGMHFPLIPGTRVAIRFINGDLTQPYIAGVLPNIRNPSPVTANNHLDNIIATRSGNKLCLNDHLQQATISLQTQQAHNYFTMLQKDKVDMISYGSLYQNININSANNILMTTNHDFVTQVGGDSKSNIEQQYSLQTLRGDIQHFSANNIDLSSQQNVSIKAYNITLHSNIALMKAEKNLQILSKQSLLIHSVNGDMHFHANHGINLDAVKALQLGDSHLGIQFSVNGEISLHAISIELNATVIEQGDISTYDA